MHHYDIHFSVAVCFSLLLTSCLIYCLVAFAESTKSTLETSSRLLFRCFLNHSRIMCVIRLAPPLAITHFFLSVFDAGATLTDVSIGLFLSRISAVDENNEVNVPPRHRTACRTIQMSLCHFSLPRKSRLTSFCKLFGRTSAYVSRMRAAIKITSN